MSPDVLIYLQTIKNYFEANEEARNYFLNNVDEELFFKYLTEIAQKNYDKEGIAQLSELQLELLRRTMLVKRIIEDTNKEENDTEKHLYFNTKGFGRVYLN